MALELIPIGTLLAVVTNQVIKTALAAKDVLYEKDSFQELSKYLFDIEPVLKELQGQELNNSDAARHALESLDADLKRANSLVEKYKNQARFYMLVKCRHIVKELQEVTRDIGRSLDSLSLANADVLSSISDQVNRLHNDMQRVEYKASQSHCQTVDRLDQAIKEQKIDQGFANGMLEEIARAVGVPVEPSEICKELESLKREKEEAAKRKEREDVFFLEQVIELLSRADAARDFNELKARYFQRVQVIEHYDEREEYIRPLNAFTCRLSGLVMVDPVSLCTGTTYERAAIEAWIDQGKRTDPETGELLQDASLRANLPLRQSIEEWREINYCLRIRSCRKKLLSGNDASIDEALRLMQDLIREDSINKDWLFVGEVTNVLFSILGSSRRKDMKRNILITLMATVEGHARNKEQLVDSEAWDHIIPLLARDVSTSKAAIELLYELLQDRSGWNVSVCRKLSQQSSAILFLVTLLKGPVMESAECAEKILRKLFDIDEENISRAAKSGWYEPLIDCVIQGPESLRITMVKSLVNMELVDSNLEIIGSEGIMPSLLEMISGNIVSKQLSLHALVKLSSCRANKRLLAAAGGVPQVLSLMFTPLGHTFVIVICCELLEQLTADGDGAKFLVDGEGSPIELGPVITNLLDFQMTSIASKNIQKPSLRVILSICKSEPELVKKAVLSANGVQIVLSLLDESDSDVREVAINLLFLFSQHEPEGVVEYLLQPRRLEALVGFLENEDKGDVQMAAAGLLANLPKSEVSLTMRLIELDGHMAILKILQNGTMEAKENALSVLFRFTDPMNVKSQRSVVEQGVYPLLVHFLKVGSVTAKARAAALIGNLSSSTPKLSVITKPSGCWCFRPRVPLCPAHGGICRVESTFCLIKANALPYLVELLGGRVHATAYEAIQTLSTLVNDSFSKRGVYVLHEANAIKPALDILQWGPDPLKEEVLDLMEKIFISRDMVEYYGSAAKILLLPFTGRNIHEDGHLGRKASRVLALLERYSKSSTSIIPGLFI